MPKGDQKLLRRYFAVARIHHHCDRCMSDILPDQEYEGQVWVMNGNLIVLKHHSDPDCPEDDWWNHDREEEHESEDLSKAA